MRCIAWAAKGMCGELMIDICEVSIRLGAFHLRDIDLQINEGEYMVLLGPTGAGKSVLLECIAGIHEPDHGSILVNGCEVSGRPPEERNVGYVPQDYALFPNMTVRQNLGYGLKARKRPAPEIREKTTMMMESLGILAIENRLPQFLSGGERQRVALGRALITRPGVLLLDEPLSALDENLRSQLAGELRGVQRDLNAAFFHVSHSLEEASLVADRIAVMRAGEIEQVGSIPDVLAKPSSLFIAEFTRARNFQEGLAERTAGGCRIKTPSGALLYSSDTRSEGPVVLAVRPEQIALERGIGARDDANSLKARVVQVRFRPPFFELELNAGFPLIAYRQGAGEFSEGDEVHVHIDPDAVLVFPRRNEALTGPGRQKLSMNRS